MRVREENTRACSSIPLSYLHATRPATHPQHALGIQEQSDANAGPTSYANFIDGEGFDGGDGQVGGADPDRRLTSPLSHLSRPLSLSLRRRYPFLSDALLRPLLAPPGPAAAAPSAPGLNASGAPPPPGAPRKSSYLDQCACARERRRRREQKS